MKAKTQTKQRRLFLLGVVLLNSWLLGLIVNWPATRVGATTSELSARGQPWSLLFRCCDVVAGGLLLLGLGALVQVGRTKHLRRIITLVMAVFAISTIVDALLPMACSPALNATCALQEQLGQLGWQHNLHILESPLVYGLILLLPLAVIWSRQGHHQDRWLRDFSIVLIMAIIAWAIDSLRLVTIHSNAFGFEQRAFTLLFSLWLVAAVLHAKPKPSFSSGR